MKDYEDRVLYVGKSKSLRTRVRSYFRKNNQLSPRIRLMVKQVVNIEYIVTDSEAEALTLEDSLIKNNQPYFNVLLKDDKKYPYLCITWSDPYPRIFITRRRRERSVNDKYYGPFVDVTLLRETLFLVKKLFPLRQRPRPLYRDRTCLNFSIGRCPGVCQAQITSEEYRETIKKVEMIFQGRNDLLKKLLVDQMARFSDSLDYENAAIIRDQLKGIEQLHQDQKLSLPDSTINRDIIALKSDLKIASIQIFQMRSGKLVGRLGYVSNSNNAKDEIVLQRIIEEHYSQVESIEVPPEILVQHELPQTKLIQEWLSEIRGRNVVIKSPRRNQKVELVQLVEKNANIELERLRKGQQAQEFAIEDLAQLLELTDLPRRLEGYDISHIQGSDAVASQVVFINGIPAKQHYRKYKIKSDDIKLGHSDDFKSLSEIIRRRFNRWSRLKKEYGDISNLVNSKASALEQVNINDWPDLIMIDGGKGQLSSVMDVLRELNLDEDLQVCSLAKKNEDIYLPGLKHPLKSSPDQIGVRLLIRLRDEAHRFALSFHRQQRNKRMTKSSLTDIPGVGPKRIKQLLRHFQSVDAIQIASLNELKAIPGLGDKLATDIYKYFHHG